ncbi:MAG: N-acetyltransferase [Elusimicrobia bacterium]|nr:N-acetyltransferase [Elusimicrobiota bacterium]MBD3412257.1 N-acetyltransferase [Elusimicrobiota bacterium]
MPKKSDYFVHETARVDEPVSIGSGSQVWHFSHIMEHARLGEKCKLGQNVFVGPGVSIGNNVKIQNNVSVYPGVTLEDDVFCGPSMVFTNIINPRSEVVRNSPEFYRQTRVKKGASIGANATVVCGVTIGSYAFVGAGAVVTRDIPDYGMVYGNPARFKGWVCACGEKLSTSTGDVFCEHCKKKYTITEKTCIRVQ